MNPKSDPIRVSRNTQLGEKVVFVDGISGTGKTMMGPILSTFHRVEVQRIEPIYQYACILEFLKRMSDDAAGCLIKMYIDRACYSAMIGRETNFRWKDISGVLSNPGGWRYLARLFMPDGDPVLARIEKERPILNITSEQILGTSAPLFSALGERLNVVEMVRNPLFLLQHWYSVIGRFGKDPRTFLIWILHKGEHLPWFAHGWEDKYLASNNMDRVIYLIEWFTRLAEDALDRLDEKSRNQVLVVPFERFVVEPWPYLKKLEQLLGTEPKKSLPKTLKRERVPRKLTTAGKDMEIYRRYGWHSPAKGATEVEELQKRWDHAAKEATPEAMDVLARISKDYEDRYISLSTTDS
tara:strand:- start:24120 stop:25178 length:1059 start_codon:yes stop_codon:yes gene_type:complete